MLTGGGHSGRAPDGVEVRGHVSLDELVSLYRRASALVFPSLYEGFGQPPLEAMACGCPVACSNAASLPEVVRRRRAATSTRHDAEAIAAAVARRARRPGAVARARPRARAAQFTWERGRARHEDVYRELL